MSEHRIAGTLGVSRKAVRQHLGRGASKETKAPTGEAPTGSGEAKDTKAPTGSTEAPEPSADESRSLCAAYQSSILEKLGQGLTAQRIFQDLRDEQGFPGRYHSVRRYVRRLTEGSELAFRRIEVAAGYEMQVDYGSGDETGHPSEGDGAKWILALTADPATCCVVLCATSAPQSWRATFDRYFDSKPNETGYPVCG